MQLRQYMEWGTAGIIVNEFFVLNQSSASAESFIYIDSADQLAVIGKV